MPQPVHRHRRLGQPGRRLAELDYDGNVLGMMKFAGDHGKTMIVSEAA
ncbi:hypothetical protein [Kitasatospora sp. NPDC007106]